MIRGLSLSWSTAPIHKYSKKTDKNDSMTGGWYGMVVKALVTSTNLSNVEFS